MNRKSICKKPERCVYLKACYLAEELKCFGYKTDCPLYQQSNGEFYSESRFNDAVDRLIDKTRARHANLKKSAVSDKSATAPRTNEKISQGLKK